MKIRTLPTGIHIEFSGGGSDTVQISEIYSIDIETVSTMTVAVDIVSLGHENGEFLEVSDEAEGFRELCAHLSKSLLINPAIESRFPVSNETGVIRVYERDCHQ